MENKEIEKFLQEIHVNFLKEGKSIWAQTSGRSMEPLIREGDFVKIIPIKVEQLERGDIVAFLSDREEKILIAHRLIKKGNNILTTCGDSFIFAADPPLAENRILGKVIAIKRNNRIKNLERGFWYFYGRVLGNLRCYGLPLLIILLSLIKLFTQPRLFFIRIFKRTRMLIR